MKVDYIFLPTIHTMKHEKSHVEHNYGCVYMQTAAVSIGKNLGLEEKGITLLSPVFDLDFGKEAMASAMLGLGKILGIPKPFCAKALLAGAMAVRKHTAAVEKLGKKLLDDLKPEDKVLVLITRNYGVSDPILNMGIPELLLERGCKVITLSHLPGHSIDISAEYPNLYWPFGQHIISGANGRYRFAKAVDMSDRADAVLTLAPRYENADIILNMRGVDEACAAPVYHIMLDHDWDETAWAKLRSFLYYCGEKNLL